VYYLKYIQTHPVLDDEHECVCLGSYERIIQRVQFGSVESEYRVSPLLHHPDPLTLTMVFVKPVHFFSAGLCKIQNFRNGLHSIHELEFELN